MYTGLKIQKDFTDDYQDMILPEDHELVKLKKIIDWDEIDKIYKTCYTAKVGNSTKQTNIVLGLILLKHLYNKSYRKLIKALHENVAFMHFCSVSFMDIQTARLKVKEKEKRTDQPLTKRKKKIYDKRAGIEAKISEGKRVTGMNKSNYKGFEGDKITAVLSIWALNARQLLRDIKERPNLMKKLT